MKRSDWLGGLRTTLGFALHHRVRRVKRRLPSIRRATFELLEDRRLLAVDFGDAPDLSPGTGPGNYNTLSTDNGAQHTIVVGLRMGANVDGDGGALQNATANADDVNGALPDDEDGLVNPEADLVLTVGAQPTVNVRVTNTVGAAATLYGWIDYNANGVFDNGTERASVAVPNGSNNVIKTLTFPAVPSGFTGKTFARFRLSTDAAAANPTAAASDGEVEDYRLAITKPSSGLADSAKSKKIASGTNGGPTLVNGDYFGRSVAAIGDVDGDGVTDLAVGANGDDSGGTARGTVYVLLMNANGTVKGGQSEIHVGEANGDYFGSSVASLGDLDGDGIPDLAVGAERDDSYVAGGTNRGAVHVLFLNANGTLKGSREIGHNDSGGPSLANGDYFGRAVASLGDLNGDGITDLAVGAYGDDTGGSDRGAVHVLFMNANGSVNSRQKIASGTGGGPSLANSDQFGNSLASLGDLDGDGVTDLAVGAVGDDTGGSGRGAMYVLFLNSSGTVKSSQKIASSTGGGPTLANDDQFGRSVAALGDLDGDGVTDLAVGAYYDDTGGMSRGAVHVLFMNANGTVKASQKIASGTGGGPTLADDVRFGVSVASLGDLDGDGLTDLAVGSNFDDTGGTNRGAVHVLFLKVFNTNPVITSPATANVVENTTAVMTVTATDGDVPAQTITFSIVGGADQSKFGITTGGLLSFLVAPDFEVPTDSNGDNVYVVTVEANDGNGGTAMQTISVTVTPVNDNSPVFTSSSGVVRLENTTSVLTVTAIDADLPPQTITFSLVGGADQARFTITSGGALSFNLPPDAEMPADADGDNVYELTVQASDGSGGTATQDIQVLVLGVNDNNPLFTSPAAANVPENTTAVMTVTATDADVPALSVTFSIVGGADQARFTITSVGALSFASAPNYEAPTDIGGDNVYVVDVQADDHQGGTTNQTIQVTVTPVNDNLPVFTSPTTVEVVENTTAVMTVTATDADLPPQVVTFLIVGGADQSKFSITSGGALSFNTPPDFGDPTDADGDNVYVVTVEASDGNGGTATRTIDVTVLSSIEYGDAPDTAAGTGPGNYQTLATDNGPQHTIVAGLRMGANVDADGGTLANAAANADDVNGALPDDEDGLVNPAADLVLTVGAQPTVSVRVTNALSAAATLYGWIDYNANGAFDNGTERASVAVPNGTNNGIVTLVFPAVPSGFTGTTYARFRLSTDAAAANPIGAASDGEVEDYRVTITKSSSGLADDNKTKKIASGMSGAPTLADLDSFGGAMTSLGDLDGDGVTDLAVGAFHDGTGGFGVGAVHVLLLNADGTVRDRQKIAHNTGGGPSLAGLDQFGRSVTPLGDLDGDGITDLAVGADRDDTGGTDRGAVYVLFLNVDGTAKSFQKIASSTSGGPTLANGDNFGGAVSSLGDLDGDGVIDLAVGAFQDDTGGTSRGAVHVLFLNSNGTVKSSQKIASGIGGGPILANDDLFGRSVAALGDLDGDGVTDLAVGAVRDDTGGTNRGAVLVLLLNSDGTVKSSQKIASGTGGGPTLANNDQFGFSVAALGDLDGDGVTDIGVGANYDGTGGTNRGAVHVLLLNANGTVKSSQKIASSTGGGPPIANDDSFGSSVASLGDLDGDGVTDLAVGAEKDNTGGTDRGAVHVLFLKKFNINPVITSPDTVNVAENTTAVLTVTASDADLPAQPVTISIVAGADQAMFSINGGGVISFNTPPDYEMPTDANGDNVYVVTVQASDGEGGSATQTISVTVTPVNDNGPVFTSVDVVNVAENSTAVMTVTATDADLPAQTVTFSIVGGADQARFGITSGGALSFNAAPNFEAPTDANGDNVYVVVVQASDGSLANVQAILVTVTPVNDNNPVFTSSTTAGVAENTTAVMAVTSTDADLPAQAVTFSIVGGADQARFGITGGGALSFNAAPNFEAPTDANGDNVYMLIVEANDGNGGTATQTINVTVTPVNDIKPVFTSPDTVSVAENTTAVLTVTASDADLPAQTVTFSIVGGADQAKFGITSGGVLSFNAAPNFEAPSDANGDNVYVLIVQASDGTLMEIQAMLITVANVSEPLGDYNFNGIVDVGDYPVWRNTLGAMVTPFSGADGSGNGIIDKDDYDVWKANFGNTLPMPAAGSGAVEASTLPEPVPVEQSTAAESKLAAQRSSEPVTNHAEVSVLPSAFVFQIDRPRGKEQKLLKADRAAIVASRDQVLLSWLASRRDGARQGMTAADLDDGRREFSEDVSSDRHADALDSVFASLGV